MALKATTEVRSLNTLYLDIMYKNFVLKMYICTYALRSEPLTFQLWAKPTNLL